MVTDESQGWVKGERAKNDRKESFEGWREEEGRVGGLGLGWGGRGKALTGRTRRQCRQAERRGGSSSSSSNSNSRSSRAEGRVKRPASFTQESW